MVRKGHELMDEHISYQQAITGKEAYKRLKRSSSGHCYLTRYSESRQCYVLSVYQKKPNNVTKHFKIIFFKSSQGNEVYKIEGKDEKFNGLEAMLTHYENNRIDPALGNIGRFIPEPRRHCIILGCITILLTFIFSLWLIH